jgi:uncharacterized membrane protein
VHNLSNSEKGLFGGAVALVAITVIAGIQGHYAWPLIAAAALIFALSCLGPFWYSRHPSTRERNDE